MISRFQSSSVSLQQSVRFASSKVSADSASTLRLRAHMRRGAFAELKDLTRPSTRVGQTLATPSKELPLNVLKGTARTLGGRRVESVAEAVSAAAPGVLLVTQKRVLSAQPIKAWREALASVAIPCTELVLVDEMLYKLLGRLLERSVRQSAPNEWHESTIHHYGKLSDDLIETCGGLEYQVRGFVVRWTCCSCSHTLTNTHTHHTHTNTHTHTHTNA